MKGQNIVVMGAGVSGLAASGLAARMGGRVTLTDMKPRSKWADHADRVERQGVMIEAGGHRKETFDRAEMVVVSPGIPREHVLIEEAMKRGVPCLSEIEYAYRALVWKGLAPHLRLIGITGTKGKTTTTTLVGELLKAAGRSVVVAGNIGEPFSAQVERLMPGSHVVLELSSFQLELVETFHPQVAVVLNISEDHLDRHVSMQAYIEAKVNIFQQQQPGDTAILNLDNRYTPLLQETTRASTVFFSRERTPARGAWLRQGVMITNMLSGHPPVGIVADRDLLIRGPHNVENAMAAIATAALHGVSAGEMATVLRSFRGVPHRQEYVGVVEGVQFINNSQGTNIDAVAKSLQSYESPIVLIAGGRSKGARFEDLLLLLKQRVKTAVLIGEAAAEMEKAWAGAVPLRRVATLEQAVGEAYRVAGAGEVVLLSPACTSFDMFRNYQDRGDQFRRAVKALARQSAKGSSHGEPLMGMAGA